METHNENYQIYDWEGNEWVTVTEDQYLKYRKKLAEIHNIMFPKDNPIGVPLILGTPGDLEGYGDLQTMFYNSSINKCKGCGTPIADGNEYCGECLCEDDTE